MRPLHSFLFVVALTASAPGALQAQPAQPAPPSAQQAPIAYLIDLTSGQVLFEREVDRRFMPASMTKVMTTFLAFEWMEDGKIFPDQTYIVRPEVWQQWSGKGSTMYLPADARVTVDDLVHGVTTVSANDGAAALADGAAGSISKWVAAMNVKAREIGMRDTHYGTPNGWMDEGRTFTTARDLVTLASAMLSRHPAKYHHYVGQTEFTFNGIAQRNHDPISGSVAGADGIKTGYTDQAGYGFLGSAQRGGRRLVMVVAASPSEQVRAVASRSLLEWGFTAFEQSRVWGPDQIIADAEVQDGDAASVGLVAPRGVYLDLPRGKQPDVKMSVRYEGPLIAPIAAGEEVAQLHVSIDGMPDYSIPLVAEQAVGKANPLERIVNSFRAMVS